MFGQVSTLTFHGVEARPVQAQVQLSGGQFAFVIVGLPDKAVTESRERVRAALHALGIGLPPKHITISLAPADLPKEGSHFDLPIVLALLVACGVIAQDAMDDYCAIGELALDGSVAPVIGALPAAIGANALGKGLICPAACGPEAAWASADMDILAPDHLLALVNHFKGLQTLKRPQPDMRDDGEALPDLRDVKGQESAKRALEVVAAGGHNMLMIGPPGSGKSMMAARLPGILPALTPAEMLEISMVHSLAGELTGGALTRRRPFRAPHHSASMVALVGGGVRPRPGEISLAHLGVLFLDELPEFSPQALDALRQPLETGETVIARANHRTTYPSHLQLVAAMNPCKCGRWQPGITCKRGRNCATLYQSRISGPLLDRIDVQIEVPAVSVSELSAPAATEGSAEVAARVQAARDIQRKRAEALGFTRVHCNAQTEGHVLERLAPLTDDAGNLLRTAAERLNLTARGYHRTLRLARTIADLEGIETLQRIHIAEALSYRTEAASASLAA
ncbi:MAG: YifB family Mg chelatase-like AAA ATPase [Pseudomonadota bacterium]